MQEELAAQAAGDVGCRQGSEGASSIQRPMHAMLYTQTHRHTDTQAGRQAGRQQAGQAEFEDWKSLLYTA
jgi:hypothetical protein